MIILEGFDLEGSSHVLIEILSWYFIGGTKENRNLIQGGQYLGKDLSLASPEYES
jgi:hypothetical protein